MILVGTRNVSEVSTAGDDVLMGLVLAGQTSSRAVGHDHQRSFVPQGVAIRDRFDTGHVSTRRAYHFRGPYAFVDAGTDGPSAFEELGVGFETGDDVAVRTVKGGRHRLLKAGGLGVEREATELSVGRLREPVTESH